MSVPTLDSKLVPFSTNFNSRIVANPTLYGVTAADASTYTAVHTPYIAAAAAVELPENRSQVLCAQRKSAKLALLPVARALYARIQKATDVTDADKLSLGITLPAERQPVPPPDSAPMLEIGERFGNTVTVHVHEAEGGSSRSRPVNVAGMTLFSYVGATPPPNVEDWKFEGQTSSTTVAVVFPDTVAPGSTVYFTAYWWNRRGESGPACTAVPAIIAGGGVAKQAA